MRSDTLYFPLNKITENCYAITNEKLFGSNAAVIILHDSIFVFDSLYNINHSILFRKELDKFLLPIKYLLISHYHGDHIFGIKAFEDINKIASFKIFKNIEKRLKTDWSNFKLEQMAANDPKSEWLLDVKILIPEILFEDKIYIIERKFGDMHIEIYNTGGHTDCSCFAYFPEDRVIITGDLVFSYQFPYGGDITCNPDKWIKSLELMLSMDAETFIPRHGPVVGKSEVKKQLDFFINLKNEIISKLKKKKEYHAIICPDYYEFNEEYPELKNVSLKKWFDFYSKATYK